MHPGAVAACGLAKLVRLVQLVSSSILVFLAGGGVVGGELHAKRACRRRTAGKIREWMPKSLSYINTARASNDRGVEKEAYGCVYSASREQKGGRER